MRKKTYSRIRGDTRQQIRIYIIMALLSGILLIPISYRLYHIMIMDYPRYAGLARANQSRTTPITPERGQILDRNGQILATSQTVENIYIAPKELQQSKANIQEMAAALGEILDLDPEQIEKRAKDLTMRYHLIQNRVNTETANRIRSFILTSGISGIHLEPNTQRYYPYHSLAAQVVGFTNASNQGAEGIEASYDSYLSGKAGKVVVTKGNNEMDMPFGMEQYDKGKPGATVITTLDVTVQACLENRMRLAMERYDVRNGGFGMVMNAVTGEILAMATIESYDPNHYLEIGDPDLASQLEIEKLSYLFDDQGSELYQQKKESYQERLRNARLEQWRNRCISDGYEPGSTFKTVTLASALDCGAVTEKDHFSCAGSEQIPGRSQLLHCWKSKGHGSQTTAQALQNSCNLAFAHIGLKLGGPRFYDYMKQFGMMEKTGIDLYGESSGVFFREELIRDTQKWGTASLTSGSFGQTFKITPLQLVRGIAAVVNGGNLVTPYVVSDVVDAEGNTLMHREQEKIRQVISPETSQIMRIFIESVVTEGTAKNATVSGYRIGGKTGTSEKIDIFDENGQRVKDKIVSFVGIAPMDDPMYIILVALDTPSPETGIYISGGVMAAPTVGEVFRDILPYLNVDQEPDFLTENLVEIPCLENMSCQEAETAAREYGLQLVIQGEGDTILSQIPQSGTQVLSGTQILAYSEQISGELTVPDFIGLSFPEALKKAGENGLMLSLEGNPDLTAPIYVSHQEPSEGTDVSPGETVRILMTDLSAHD